MGKTQFKIEQMVKELILITGANDIKDVIENIVVTLFKLNCSLTPCTPEVLIVSHNMPVSKVSCSENEEPLQILLNKDSANYTVIWDLLHEYGHVLDGSPTDVIRNHKEELSREQRAWDLGKNLLKNHPEYWDQYDARNILNVLKLTIHV